MQLKSVAVIVLAISACAGSVEEPDTSPDSSSPNDVEPGVVLPPCTPAGSSYTTDGLNGSPTDDRCCEGLTSRRPECRGTHPPQVWHCTACGDGVCDEVEAHCNCPEDCDEVEAPARPECTPVGGKYITDGLTGQTDDYCCEGLTSIIAGCEGAKPPQAFYCTACGDGVCDEHEDCGDCPEDCG